MDDPCIIYFDYEVTRQSFIDRPIDHPFHLVGNPYYEAGEAEGYRPEQWGAFVSLVTLDHFPLE